MTMNFLITAGGTREYIDPVRFISNASSGKMGYALAAAALKAGHRLRLLPRRQIFSRPKAQKLSMSKQAQRCLRRLKKYFAKCDCLIMAAAVSDYAPAKTSKTKIKKRDKALTIKLKPTTDILKWAGRAQEKSARRWFCP